MALAVPLSGPTLQAYAASFRDEFIKQIIAWNVRLPKFQATADKGFMAGSSGLTKKSAALYQIMVDGEHNELCAVRNAELVKDAGNVMLNRVLA